MWFEGVRSLGEGLAAWALENVMSEKSRTGRAALITVVSCMALRLEGCREPNGRRKGGRGLLRLLPNAVRRLRNQRGDSLRLRHEDRVAALHLHDGRSGTLRHRLLRGRRDHPIGGRDEVPAGLG